MNFPGLEALVMVHACQQLPFMLENATNIQLLGARLPSVSCLYVPLLLSFDLDLSYGLFVLKMAC